MGHLYEFKPSLAYSKFQDSQSYTEKPHLKKQEPRMNLVVQNTTRQTDSCLCTDGQIYKHRNMRSLCIHVFPSLSAQRTLIKIKARYSG